MKVLITGGAGFIGANLVWDLASRSDVDEVVALEDLPFGYQSNLDGTDVQFVEGSILDEQVLADASLGTSAIVHLSARSSMPRSIAESMAAHEVNTTGTQ